MNNPVLSVNNLYKSFTSASEDLHILTDLHLEIPSAAKIAITGESGCGKSTLLNIIGGMEAADSGKILAGSYNLLSLTEAELTEYRRHFLGLIFQFHYLLKDFTALENIMLPALIAGKNKKEIKERALSLIADVRLENRKDHFPAQLSGGERQRIAVARALINDPMLVLADEPTGNLDPQNAASVQDLLFSLTDKHGKTLLIVTHDPGIASMADSCYRLEHGKLVAV
ncbi:ABC transporter ATP-binding protein [Treponema phagedenis]|uniref:ABC transporter ATP-binding protein n=1 Tax=Treponema phagedenis TaxID=162 RepID=A0A0B7GVN0_TREPH|nr:ABC transporter ATP-binding protein [Treponema phagedenis]EFW39396.1 ABC transporter, ATP-binding protein [Treponema phagedenis F0421]NVP22987.1 ABC transporter ATP-binding protein [Treponema phagedenis]QEJ95109.1 ABC transporter ATP-binding protein [Treponema phagedenis]QEJ98217.1 ABC transporter ATP-binding protein [Treponema phagedenis]QEK01034.1 ABC transporter ATP-binding protein [Treponema phagedenis]